MCALPGWCCFRRRDGSCGRPGDGRVKRQENPWTGCPAGVLMVRTRAPGLRRRLTACHRARPQAAPAAPEQTPPQLPRRPHAQPRTVPDRRQRLHLPRLPRHQAAVHLARAADPRGLRLSQHPAAPAARAQPRVPGRGLRHPGTGIPSPALRPVQGQPAAHARGPGRADPVHPRERGRPPDPCARARRPGGGRPDRLGDGPHDRPGAPGGGRVRRQGPAPAGLRRRDPVGSDERPGDGRGGGGGEVRPAARPAARLFRPHRRQLGQHSRRARYRPEVGAEAHRRLPYPGKPLPGGPGDETGQGGPPTARPPRAGLPVPRPGASQPQCRGARRDRTLPGAGTGHRPAAHPVRRARVSLAAQGGSARAAHRHQPLSPGGRCGRAGPPGQAARRHRPRGRGHRDRLARHPERAPGRGEPVCR